MSNVQRNGPSPSSTIGMSSAKSRESCQSPQKMAPDEFVMVRDMSISPQTRCHTHCIESPAVLGGASLPPPSPEKSPHFYVEAVGIPTSKRHRNITNRNELTYNDGYDSDGNVGPFLDAIMNESDRTEEEEDDDLPASMLAGAHAQEGEVHDEAQGEGTPAWFLFDDVIKQMKVDQLKVEIGRRGLKPKGNKSALVQMLQDCMEKRLPIIEGPVANMNELSGFPVGSKWKLLSPSSVIEDPPNLFNMHAPTDDPDLLPTLQKQNYDEIWDRPVFEGRSKAGGIRFKGEVRSKFIKDSNLTIHSHPVDWVSAFFPVYEKPARSKSETPYHLSSKHLCRWSNEKAQLLEMGTKGYYQDFVPFSTEEWEKYLYLFFFNGLNPSPQVEMKLKTEQQDPVNSNAFLRRELGPNALRRFKEWKACFAAQDPKIPIPSHKTHPNFKVDEYFRHLQLIFRYAWLPGRDLSGDEQTMGFKGRHRDKLRISYKKEGDGFQCDCLADDGYTFTFYFRNQPAPKKYIDMGYSPLHARCFALFDCLMDKYHQVRFDNLYMSAKFCLGSFQHAKQVMVEGVTRTNQRGLPREVIQHDVKNPKDIMKVKGTVKVAVLENCGPLNASPLVAASVYDNKGVHFLSTCVEKVEWVEKTRMVWDRSSEIVREGTFLCLSVNDSYNMNMNNVDIADQLRNQYRPDKWMRKQKWWWSMFFGGMVQCW